MNEITLLFNHEKQGKIATTRDELPGYILDRIFSSSKKAKENTDDMEARIQAKIQSGAKLTEEELDYLRKTNPYLYSQIMRIQRMAEAVKQQLKTAKSKEEANQIAEAALSSISENDPFKEAIVAAINRVIAEFKSSTAYANLPDTNEEAEKRINKDEALDSDESSNDLSDDGDSEKFSLLGWSPLQEVYNALPTFEVRA